MSNLSHGLKPLNEHIKIALECIKEGAIIGLILGVIESLRQ